MRNALTPAAVAALSLTVVVQADVLITMPAPPVTRVMTPETSPEREVELGEVALARYRRPSAPDPTADGGSRGWWGGPWLGGGYRISLSPHHVYARRGWNGGYYYPGWYGWP
ncbi:MAG: hypothetical protein HKO59_15095 [Phycisphaerales bacterium]|nr:hypothetical protein [Phycisphaerae bacterium]NNF43248.1 hypothetical protein [Phycisphaerales bacterium]NNM27286.1 hypothetical protein [Phycisphaerales bacterium]